MAYNLVDRFPRPPKCPRLFDPGTYQFEKRALKTNTAPFLSKNPRNTSSTRKVWTQAIYDSAIPHRIHNITSLKSTAKRFPYEAFSAEDLEQLLCRCGVENHYVIDPEVEEMCQKNVKRRLFKGPVPTGLERRIAVKDKNKFPPFYDARVNESTAFYRGCKWSRRTSKRSNLVIQSGPGPADYCLESTPAITKICDEKVRALKRKTCKQMRYIEKVQQQNILENKPGPGAYSPELPKGTNLQYVGPKAARFSCTYSVSPGPADHWLRRDFDPVDLPEVFCQAKLPAPACFGVKAKRFIPQKEQGPSPASYNAIYKPCNIVHCSKAPFGTSTIRFKANILDECDDEAIEAIDECPENPTILCPNLTWEFKSKTIRIKPLIKDTSDSPELCKKQQKVERSPKLQYIAPFNSSEGRFQPWYNNIPVHGISEGPPPCYYNSEIPEPLPAVPRGPLSRAKRFPSNERDTPAPNQYEVFGGIESILKTHNTRLAANIKKKIKFIWEAPPEIQSLTCKQRELMLIQKCITLLDPDVDLTKKIKPKTRSNVKSQATIEKSNTDKMDKSKGQPKMLRCFLYSRQIPNYF